MSKALYDLKQALRAWNRRLDAFLSQQGFFKYSVEFGVYVKLQNTDDLIMVCLYVDDLLVTGSDKVEIEKFNWRMKSEFEMTDL